MFAAQVHTQRPYGMDSRQQYRFRRKTPHAYITKNKNRHRPAQNHQLGTTRATRTDRTTHKKRNKQPKHKQIIVAHYSKIERVI